MPDSAPTNVRHSVLAITTGVAFMMYLDRICMAWIVDSKSFTGEMNLSPTELSWVKGVFFWAYAIAQVPAGWLSDRFGARVLMTTYIILWSLFTIATSLSAGFVTLLIARIGCGLAEAGAYPASSSILTKWAHINWRGVGSSIISSGGRLGGALAPWLTASVIIATLSSWRWVGWIYGVAGIAVAVGFWIIFRDHPKQHPKVNQAELDILAEGRGDFVATREPPRRFPWKAAMTSRSLWMASLYQTATNIGWAFLVNSLSAYLAQVKHLDETMNGRVSSIALTIGIVGLWLGGMLTDYWSKKYGLRLGRLLPLVVTRLVAVGAYFGAMAADTPVELAIGFGLLAIFVDMGMPAMWTLMQDISGRHQAQLFGWANMWGNFGAGLQPILVAWIVLHYDSNHDYREPMFFSAGMLLLSIFLAFGIDASKPVVKEETA